MTCSARVRVDAVHLEERAQPLHLVDKLLRDPCPDGRRHRQRATDLLELAGMHHRDRRQGQGQ